MDASICPPGRAYAARCTGAPRLVGLGAALEKRFGAGEAGILFSGRFQGRGRQTWIALLFWGNPTSFFHLSATLMIPNCWYINSEVNANPWFKAPFLCTKKNNLCDKSTIIVDKKHGHKYNINITNHKKIMVLIVANNQIEQEAQ